MGDSRGIFVKTWQKRLDQVGLQPDEVFFSISKIGTVRGMHVQAGKTAGRRLVFVTKGAARDFIIDLRIGSPTFGQTVENSLTPNGNSIVVPPGCAHGFEAIEDDTTMVYLQEGAHDAEYDVGVHWRSCGFEPLAVHPIVSERDESLPRLSEFVSPFRWKPE